jgi:thiol-disulfide isomerase/thioredoxin
MTANMPRLAVIALVLLGLVACKKEGVTPPSGNILEKLSLPAADGTTFDAKTLAGKPTVVVFWRPGCPHCREEMPIVRKVCKEKGCNAVAVQVAESPESGKRALEHSAWEGASLIDDGSVRKGLGIDKVPWTLVLRPDGTAAYAFVGAQKYGTLASAIGDVK